MQTGDQAGAGSKGPAKEGRGRPRSCPFCGAEVAPERKVCANCGFDFEQMNAEGAPAGAETFDPLTVICFKCGAPNPKVADFCAQCSTAIGPYSALKPFEEIFVEGQMCRSMAKGSLDWLGPSGYLCVAVIFTVTGLCIMGFWAPVVGAGLLYVVYHFTRGKKNKETPGTQP